MGGAGGASGTGGPLDWRDSVSSSGIDRGFIFFENSGGAIWRGLTGIDENEEDFRMESYYVDGRKVAHTHIAGTYSASVTSFDDPFGDINLDYAIFGFTYRERYTVGEEEYYKLHIVHNVSVVYQGSVTETVNTSEEPTTHGWELYTTNSDLAYDVNGAHIIIDSGVIQEWIMRDLENILYGTLDEDQPPRIPSIEEIYDIFATMNLVIIDHGDGTWSAVGHETMIKMLDATEFAIDSPTAEYVEEDTYEIESLIRDERWLE